MGAEVKVEQGYVHAKATRLKGRASVPTWLP
jgi:hypothetical protein